MQGIRFDSVLSYPGYSKVPGESSRLTGALEPSSEAGNDSVRKAGRKSSPEECQTCKERKYQDGSNENVSFKSASHISPEAAASAVRSHEGEHVSNAYSKAAQKSGSGGHAAGGHYVEDAADVEIELLKDEKADGDTAIVATVTKTRKNASGRSFMLDLNPRSLSFGTTAERVMRLKPAASVFNI